LNSQGSFLDHHIHETEIGAYVQEGENKVSLIARPFHPFMEIEPIYICGDFTVQDQAGRWMIGKQKKLTIGAWNEQGYPFYAGAIHYQRKIFVPDGTQRVSIYLPLWKGAVASITVDGKAAGLIGIGQGNSLDITQFTTPGNREIVVRICGTMRNLLGPHHHPDRPRGMVWSSYWRKSPKFGPPPAADYDILPYGLLDDMIIQIQ
jgi:hypothetical protein